MLDIDQAISNEYSFGIIHKTCLNSIDPYARNVPSMSFGESRCTWECIRREILGDFAPETGLVKRMRRVKDRQRAMEQRRKSVVALLQFQSRSLLGGAFAGGLVGKIITKSAESDQSQQQREKELEQEELRRKELSRLFDRRKANIIRGCMYELHDGSSKVFCLCLIPRLGCPSSCIIRTEPATSAAAGPGNGLSPGPPMQIERHHAVRQRYCVNK